MRRDRNRKKLSGPLSLGDAIVLLKPGMPVTFKPKWDTRANVTIAPPSPPHQPLPLGQRRMVTSLGQPPPPTNHYDWTSASKIYLCLTPISVIQPNTNTPPPPPITALSKPSMTEKGPSSETWPTLQRDTHMDTSNQQLPTIKKTQTNRPPTNLFR